MVITADVGEKIVAAAGGKVVDMAADLELGGVVDEAVQRSVSSGDHNPVIVPEGTKDGSVIIDFRDIAEQQPVVRQQYVQPIRGLMAASAPRVGIV